MIFGDTEDRFKGYQLVFEAVLMTVWTLKHANAIGYVKICYFFAAI